MFKRVSIIKSKQQLRYGIITVFLCICVFFTSSLGAQATSNTSLNQTIIPVKIVSINTQGKPIGLWSNVSDTDSMYIVQFINDETKKNIPTDTLLSDKNFSRDILLFIQQNEYHITSKTTQQVNLIQQGTTVEEVRTRT